MVGFLWKSGGRAVGLAREEELTCSRHNSLCLEAASAKCWALMVDSTASLWRTLNRAVLRCPSGMVDVRLYEKE